VCVLPTHLSTLDVYTTFEVTAHFLESFDAETARVTYALLAVHPVLDRNSITKSFFENAAEAF